MRFPIILNRKYGLDYDYNHEIMVTVGGSEAIDIAMRAMLDPGDEVSDSTAKLCIVSAMCKTGRRCSGGH